MERYNTLYVFGDSFSTPHYCVDPIDSYWGLLARNFNIPNVANFSYVGQPWEGVLHSLVAMSKKIKFDQSLIIVAIPPLERRLKFDNDKNTEHMYYEYSSDWQEFISVNEHQQGLETADVMRISDILYDRSWVESMLLRELFLLTKWLDKENANYLVINTCGKDLDKENFWGPSVTTLRYIIKHKNVMMEDTYHNINIKDDIKPVDFDEHSWDGHHGAEGNYNFYMKSLLPELNKLSLL